MEKIILKIKIISICSQNWVPAFEVGYMALTRLDTLFDHSLNKINLSLAVAPAANMYMTDFYMTAIKQRLVFKMVACYIICAIPFFAALSLVTNFLVTAFSINVQDVSAAEQILIGVIAEFTYLLIGITVTVATAAGMRSFFGKPIPKNIEKE